MKAMRGRIALRKHFPHTAGRQCETVERVVLNALANQLRLCRRVSCAFGEEQKSSSGEADPPSHVAQLALEER